MDYLSSLNEPQYQGVVNTEGPTMIIAGAGSGKTRVLTYRIAYLIKEKNIDPFHILALTFTNKAAKEMRERIEAVVGNEARNLWMGTFHSVFARILRSESEKLGYLRDFTVYDTDDSKSLIKAIVKEFGLDDKMYKPNVVLNRISGAKNRLVGWKEYIDNPLYLADDESAMKPEMGRLYKAYCLRCFKAGAMDFDDLLYNTNVLFRDHADVLHKYQHRFKYVLVDEFQDTNISQYLITKKLSAVSQNIAVVGDDAQSIYAFRGASIDNILNFEKDFPDLNTIRLEQNYRSTQNIVNVANSVIARNKSQLKKTVWTANTEGTQIDLIKSISDQEEGRFVASAIFEQKTQNSYKNSDFAVLYRTNRQSRAIEEALRKAGINYRIYGGLSFYQRKEIKDLMAYLRFSINTADEQAFRRIINLPKRGIGAASVEKIVVAAFEHDIPLWEVLTNIEHFLPGRIANAVRDFVTLIKSFRIYAESHDAYEAASHIAKNSGLLKELYDDKTIEGLNRYENVQELLNAVKEYADNPEVEDKTISAFLQEVALLTDQDNDKNQDTDFVTLMTIHAAKGLEFKNVFVVGLEEDLFPSKMMLSSRADLEEERRLFYVAITRAKENLFFSYALSRYYYGKLMNCEPSRFIDEVDSGYLRVNTRYGSRQPQLGGAEDASNLSSGYARNLVKKRKPAPKKPPQYHKPSADFVASNTADLQEGMKVEHPKFGFGKVRKMDVQGANRKARVIFENFGEKTLLLSFAKLRIIESC